MPKYNKLDIYPEDDNLIRPDVLEDSYKTEAEDWLSERLAEEANKKGQKNKMMDYGKLKASIAPLIDGVVAFKPQDQITTQEWVELKESVSPINNFITAELVKAFIRELPALFPSKNINVEALLAKFNEKENVNSNGYDFRDDDLKIVAEMKANRPYQENAFGPAQKDGIEKDVKGMLEGKTKGGLPKEQLQGYYKFQVMMKYEKGTYSTTSAIQRLWPKSSLAERVDRDLVIGDMENKPKDKVYFIQLDL